MPEQHSLKPKLLWSKDEIVAATSLSKGFIEKLIRANQIKIVRIGRRVLVSDNELHRFLEEGTSADYLGEP